VKVLVPPKPKPADERLRHLRLLRAPRNVGILVRLKSLKLRSKYLRCGKAAIMVEFMI